MGADRTLVIKVSQLAVVARNARFALERDRLADTVNALDDLIERAASYRAEILARLVGQTHAEQVPSNDERPAAATADRSDS